VGRQGVDLHGIAGAVLFYLFGDYKEFMGRKTGGCNDQHSCQSRELFHRILLINDCEEFVSRQNLSPAIPFRGTGLYRKLKRYLRIIRSTDTLKTPGLPQLHAVKRG
jgi:hypothetical protein